MCFVSSGSVVINNGMVPHPIGLLKRLIFIIGWSMPKVKEQQMPDG